jgi:NAD(P)-dependent dehydrogenase (short-subunit alcohol dehydrogenase family)
MTLPLKMMKPEHYEKLFSVNVISGFEVAKIISNKKYSDNSGASFVFISSIMSVLGEPGKVGYCASKGALISGVKAMALELVNKNIRVNCISPAIVETDMTKKLFDNIPEDSKHEIIKMHPMGFGKPEDVANACLFLLSDASCWITGSNLIVDGGYSAR